MLFDEQTFMMEAYVRGLPTGFWTKDQANRINRLLEAGVLNGDLRVAEDWKERWTIFSRTGELSHVQRTTSK
jgi:hypothetical protein